MCMYSFGGAILLTLWRDTGRSGGDEMDAPTLSWFHVFIWIGPTAVLGRSALLFRPGQFFFC